MKGLILMIVTGMLLLSGLAVCHGEEMDFSVPEGFDVKRDDVTYGKVEFKTYYSNTCGQNRKCFIVLPPNYQPEKAYPVVYLLHGIGGSETEWMGGRPDAVLGNLVACGEAKEMIAVLPNIKAYPAGTYPSGNIYSAESIAAFDNFINDLRDDLMPFIKETYNILEGPENTAVCGLSMGGREALYIGLSMPETFGYIGAFTPAPGILAYTGFTAEAGMFTAENFKVQEGYNTFIMINAGTTDGVVGTWPKTYSDTLTKNGTEHIFYETAGGHDFTVWKNGLYNFAKMIFQD